MGDFLIQVWAHDVYRKLILSAAVWLAAFVLGRVLPWLAINRLPDESPHSLIAIASARADIAVSDHVEESILPHLDARRRLDGDISSQGMSIVGTNRCSCRCGPTAERTELHHAPWFVNPHRAHTSAQRF